MTEEEDLEYLLETSKNPLDREFETKIYNDVPKILLDSGTLYQINRTILNPIGLHMIAEKVENVDTNDVFYELELHETSNPLGYIMSDDEAGAGQTVFEHFMKTRKIRAIYRQKTLGYLVQPEPELE